MIEEIIQDADKRMGKSVDALQVELVKIRTGRAHPSILDQVKVDYYGTDTPLNQVANINIEDSRTLTVTPWEKPMVAAIEKAIINSDLGLNPMSAGTVIRIPLPALTEERRRDLVKIVKNAAENSRIAIRNIRRDANSDFKELLKEKEISEDEFHQSEDEVQKITDKHVSNVDKILTAKETELMEV